MNAPQDAGGPLLLLPRTPRGSERLSAVTAAILLAYVVLFASGQAADGGGWALALLGFAFVLYGAPLLTVIAAIVAITTRQRRTQGGLVLALIFAAGVFAFDMILRMSRDFTPRGPLG